MDSFKLKFKFLGTIELNFRFFQLKALNIYRFLGQFRFKPGPLLSTFFKSRPWMSWTLQLFSSQGLESLNPSTFFNPRKPWKNPKLIVCSAICIIHFSDAYIVHLLSNSKFYGCIPTYSIKCILQNWNASCLSTWAMQKGQIAPLDFVGGIDFALQMYNFSPICFSFDQ